MILARKAVWLLLMTCSMLLSTKAYSNIPVDPNLFVFTVDASIADDTAVGSYKLPIVATNYQLYWEEVGNEASNNSSGLVHVTSANHILVFGASGTYKIGIDPINVPTGVNDFSSVIVANAGDKSKLLNISQWGTTSWATMNNAFWGASNFTGFTATDIPDVSSVVSFYNAFRSAPLLVDTVGMGSWDTSSVDTMYAMFFDSPLVTPDTSGWDTSLVKNMASVFGSATAANPDTSGWDTSSVTTMVNMFKAATSANPDTSGWDVSSVNEMTGLFNGATSANPDTSGWDTSSVTSMYQMFNGASMANPDTSGWNTSLVQSMYLMFNGATVANPDTSGWDTSAVINMGGLFKDAAAATPDTSGWDTSSVTNMASMFIGASLANPDTSGWDTSSVTTMVNMFNAATSANPDTSGWDTSSVTIMYQMFNGASMANPDTSGWNTSLVRSMYLMFNAATVANPDTSGWDTSAVINMGGLFKDAAAATPDTSGWDTSSVTNMASMFIGASLANPDTSGWDTSSVTNMASMFAHTSLANPDTSGWDTSSVAAMDGMFSFAEVADPDTSSWDTSSLTNITNIFHTASVANPDVSNWNTSAVTNMGAAFYGMPLGNPDVSAWDTSAATRMQYMFGDTLVANPDVSAWDTSLVFDMRYMFRRMSGGNPDVSAWDTSAATVMTGMFEDASAFTGSVENFDVSGVTDAENMFLDTSMTTAQYDAMLSAWASQSLQSNVLFHAGSSTYCEAGTARDDLINNNSWTITDGGLDCTVKILAEILEDSASGGGANNTNATSITAAELAGIAGIANVDAANETRYQAAIAANTGFSNPPTVAEVQAVIDAVNTSQDVIAEVLEDSNSVGGATNTNGTAVTAAQLAAITGITGVDAAYSQGYQEAIAAETGFSNPPTVAEIQAIIDRVNAFIPVDANLFVFTIDATVAGETAAGSFKLPVVGDNYQLYWTEVGNELSNHSAGAVHVTSAGETINFGAPGIYQVGIDPVNVPTGANNFDDFRFNSAGDKDKLQNVSQWGTTIWSTMRGAFMGASNFTGFTATDFPDLSAVTTFYNMFRGTPLLLDTVGMGSWDISTVTTLYAMFYQSPLVNPDVSAWDTSAVTNMASVFGSTGAANPDVSAWDTSAALTMGSMFRDASAATPDVSAWDIAAVTDLSNMFKGTPLANPDTGAWNTSAVTNMAAMFHSAAAANPDVSAWDTSAVTNMAYLFSDTTIATPDTSAWDTSSVVNMGAMFFDAAVANPDVSGWDTSLNTSMASMFRNAGAFVGSVDTFDVSSVTNAVYMFLDSGTTTAQYDAALTAWASQTVQSGVLLGMGSSTYCLGESARDDLINNTGWDITDLGLDCTVNSLAEVLEDSASGGGANNSNATPVTAAALDGIAGIANVDVANEAQYQAAIAANTSFSTPPTVAEVQAVIDAVNASQDAFAEILEDSNSAGGATNTNAAAVTAAQLAAITGIAGVDAANEAEYQAAITAATNLSNSPTLAEVQAIIDAVNASQDAFAEILEGSNSAGGATNTNAAAVTAAQLAAITGIAGVDAANEAEYQAAIAAATNLSNPPTLAEVQAIIDAVNASEAALASAQETFNSTDPNAGPVTAEQLAAITGIEAVDPANESQYQAAIANAENLSSPPTVEEMQAIIDEVNTSEEALASVAETLNPSDPNAAPVTAAELASITGVTDVDPANEAQYQAAIADAENLSTPPTAEEIQAIIDAVNASEEALASVAESLNPSYPNAAPVTAAELAVINGVEGVDPANEQQYQAAIANAASLSTPPTVEDIQALIDEVNASQVAIAAVLNASTADGGAASITAAQLASITGVRGIVAENEAQYQAAIASSDSLSSPPTAEEIQAIIDSVNDTDADGISDLIEQGQDTDNDGIADNLDLDSDNDGISDSQEGSVDTDSDGIPNFRDLDSDNDGLFDLVEGQNSREGVAVSDVNQDGMVDAGEALGANGLLDSVETNADSGEVLAPATDTDGDSTPDYIDIDSDNDGVTDILENSLEATTASVSFEDQSTARSTASDVLAGLLSDDSNAVRDTDDDGVANYRDGDSDNDGILDVVESYGPSYDVNGDGQLDDYQDANGNGLSDNLETVSLQPSDTDGDGQLNQFETDSDSDGLSDLLETGGVDANSDGQIDDLVDSDGDGVDDGVATFPTQVIDTDNDGLPDYQDTDSDNDGVSDLVESGGVDANGDGRAEGLTLGAALPDVDGDNVPNHLQAASGEFVTVGQGGAGGCSLVGRRTNAGVDPLMPALAFIALFYLALRRRGSLSVGVSSDTNHTTGANISVKNPNRKAILALGPIVLFIGSGCSSMGTAPADEREPSEAAASYASGEGTEFKRRVWLGAGAGVSSLSPDVSQAPSVDVSESADAGGQLTLGIDVTSRMAVELHKSKLGAPELSSTGAPEYSHSGGSALIYLGNKQRVKQRRGLMPYGRIGYGVLNVGESQAGNVPIIKANTSETLLGAGLEYGTKKGLGLRAEIIAFQQDVQYAQVGMIYRFGRRSASKGNMIAATPNENIETVTETVAAVPELLTSDFITDEPILAATVEDRSCTELSGQIASVNFEHDSSALDTAAKTVLNDILGNLLDCQNALMQLEGHSDSMGSVMYNQRLSQRRVGAVLSYFEDQGVSLDRFDSDYFGETKPLVSNGSEDGRAANRRVTLIGQ